MLRPCPHILGMRAQTTPENSLPHFEAGHIFTDGFHRPCHVDAQDLLFGRSKSVRGSDGQISLAMEIVERVDGSIMDFDQYPIVHALLDDWRIDLFDLQDF